MKHLFTLGVASCSIFGAQAQLTVTDSLSVGAISTLLEGIGVTVSNVAVNCAGAAMGQFNGPSELSITQGLVLTTGSADAVAGHVASVASGYVGTPGDATLDPELLGGLTQDACGLEFDCIPQGDTLLFNFSFGSEEYPEFVMTGFNDAFAIYITGPGFTVPTNVAAIPGGTLVSINNVNDGVNNMFFHNNESFGGQYVAYDGFTTNLSAFAVVQPGETYHFKVVVADVQDGILDSGVFLEAFSFRSPVFANGVSEVSNGALQLIAQGDAHVLRVPTGMAKGQEVLVFDATGSLVRRQPLTGLDTALPSSNWGAGMYIVQVPGFAPLRFVKK